MIRAFFIKLLFCIFYKFLNMKILILWFLGLTITTSFSQISQERLKHITNENGLSNTTVNCIFQGSRGFMYFGTRDGLNRYDGINMMVFKNNPANPNSISDNFIRCIYETENDQFWIGTSYGLNRFDRVNSKFISYKHNPKSNQSLSSSVITSVSPADKNTLWIATLGGGLNYFDTKTGKAKHFRNSIKNKNSISSDSINCIFKDKQNRLWIGTQKGVDCIDTQNFSINSNILNNANPIKAIVQDTNGFIWISVENVGLICFDAHANRIKLINNEKSNLNIISLFIDKKGNL